MQSEKSCFFKYLEAVIAVAQNLWMHAFGSGDRAMRDRMIATEWWAENQPEAFSLNERRN